MNPIVQEFLSGCSTRRFIQKQTSHRNVSPTMENATHFLPTISRWYSTASTELTTVHCPRSTSIDAPRQFSYRCYSSRTLRYNHPRPNHPETKASVVEHRALGSARCWTHTRNHKPYGLPPKEGRAHVAGDARPVRGAKLDGRSRGRSPSAGRSR